MKRLIFVAMCIILGTGVAFASLLLAAEEEYDDYMLEEVVVSARKQAEDMQDVPISITAVSSDAILQQSISVLDEITMTMPNVSTDGYGQTDSVFSIRGLSTTSNNPGFESGIGLYIDEVYVGKSYAFNTALLGADRIEVLRGPQGTLFGRNTIGGVINVYTKDPGHELEAEVDVTYGNYEQIQVRGLVSGPIVKGKATGLVSGMIKNRDGFLDDYVTGQDYNNEDSSALRGKLHLNLTDGVGLDISADYYQDDNISGISDVRGGALLPVDGTPLSDRTIGTDFDSFGNRESFGTAARLVWGLEQHSIVSISAYRSHEQEGLLDQDFSIVNFSFTGRKQEQTQFSQEIRISSQHHGPFNYLLGLYYFHTDADALTTANLGSDAMAALLGVPLPGETAFADSQIDGDAYAVFGSVNYKITDDFVLSGGLRYSYEDKDLVYAQPLSPGAFVLPLAGIAVPIDPLNDNVSDGAISGDASITYILSDDASLYASYRLGFKAGGFNATILGYTPDQLRFDKETVNQYEIGLKSTLMNNRLRFNAAAFYLDYQDKQEQVTNNANFTVANAGEATVYGYEVELAARPHRNLELHGSIGYMDTEYDSFPGADFDPATGAPVDATGNELQNAPEYTINIGGRYQQPLTDSILMTLSGELLYEGSNFLVPTNDPNFIKESGTFVNARLSIESISGKWSVAFWGKNIFEKEREHVSFDFLGTQYVYQADPRTYGLEVRLKL